MSKTDAPPNAIPAIEAELSEAELHMLFENMISAFSYYRMIYDEQGNAVDYVVLAVNRAFEQTTGLRRADIIGKNILSIFPQTEKYWIESFGRVGKTGVSEHLSNYAAAFNRWYSIFAYAPLPEHVAITVSDITDYVNEQASLRQTALELQAQQKENERLAHEEPITGLPNRACLIEAFARKAEDALSERFSVAIITPDNLAEILASYGSMLSDQIMRILAQRVRMNMEGFDACFSMTGTDIVLLFSLCCDERKIQQALKRVLSLIRQVVEVEGARYYITASCGVSCFPRDGADHDELIMKANLALYQAKRTGNAIAFFNEQIGQTLLRRTQIRNALPNALENDEFELYFQPQLHPIHERVLGFEALLRWHSAVLGEVSPLEFIPVAEESRLIQPLGLWVLKHACQALRRINEQYKTDLFIAVNVSGLQLQMEDFVEQVFSILTQTGIRPALLELEVTESVLVEHDRCTIEKLNALYDRGVCLALDDFGTGFSSLSLLKDVKISTLKIDKSFLQSTGVAELVKMIVRLARLFGAKAVAEGIETEEQMRLARQAGCDRVQGFYLALPMPLNTLLRYLEAKLCR